VRIVYDQERQMRDLRQAFWNEHRELSRWVSDGGRVEDRGASSSADALVLLHLIDHYEVGGSDEEAMHELGLSTEELEACLLGIHAVYDARARSFREREVPAARIYRRLGDSRVNVNAALADAEPPWSEEQRMRVERVRQASRQGAAWDRLSEETQLPPDELVQLLLDVREAIQRRRRLLQAAKGASRSR
jgi:hypothetical protein